MNKLTYILCASCIASVALCAFMYGREYQILRINLFIDKVDQESYCTSNFYKSNKDGMADFDGYCLDYNNRDKGENNES